MTAKERFDAKVEKSDKCWMWTASKDSAGYGKMYFEGRVVGAHRISFLLHNGDIPEGYEVDHECHVVACVNPDHLRLATPKQNVEHRNGAQANNTAGVRGVRWHKRVKKWEAVVTHHGKQIFLGYFTEMSEASEAARVKRAELFTFPETAAA